MADRTVYVDGTTSGTPGTDGARYATLQAAITGEVGAAPDLVTDTAILNIECSVFSGDAADTTPATINGFTTSSSYYVNLYAAAADYADGVWSDSKYRLYVANATALTISDDWTRVHGLQLGKSASNANNQRCISFGSLGTSDIWLYDLITKHAASDVFRQGGIGFGTSSTTLYIWNWIDYAHPADTSFYNASLVVDGASTVYVSSATLIGYSAGIATAHASAVINARNVYCSGSQSHDFWVALGGTINLTTCASSDTSGSAGLQSIAVNTTNFTNVTAGSEDYTLPGTGSALYNVGTDGPQAAPLDFTDSIDGVTRTSTWDVGASEVDDGGLSASLGEPVIGGSTF